MIYSVNNNSAVNYSKTFARPKWQVNIFKIVDPFLINKCVVKNEKQCAGAAAAQPMKNEIKKTKTNSKRKEKKILNQYIQVRTLVFQRKASK